MNGQKVIETPAQAEAIDALRRLQEDAGKVPEGPDLRWAHRIIERYRAGEQIRSATLRMAREALGIKQ